MWWPLVVRFWPGGLYVCMRWANERWHYIVMLSLIGWGHTQNDPWKRKEMRIICYISLSLKIHCCHWQLSLTDINSLAPGRFQFNFRQVIFKPTLVNGGWEFSYEIALRWMPLDLTDDTSTLVQVMAWCRQATSHYLSQCWPRSMSAIGITRPQWVKPLSVEFMKK